MEAKENEENMESVKAELLLITNNFWQALADRDIEKRFLQCADTITFIGTGLDEKAYGKAAYYAINKKGVEQYPEKFKLSVLWERASVVEDMGWVESETEWTQMINGKEEKTLIRNTIVLKKTDGKWWIVHVHGSVPDFRLSGQNYITNAETIKINRELEREVYQRTKELNQKNRELEIESSLERVRTVAMSMRKPDDMLEVCQTISDQLKILGIGEIRNVQTAIVEGRDDGHYMNYQYFPQYDKRIIEDVEIGKHPNVQAMINRMQQSPDAFFSHSFTGIALEEWKQYRKDDHQFPDPILDEANQVHFYFYSIGQGGLGLSAYTLLTENQIALFQRFRNVFTLAYQRFRDIEQAEAQAREAQVEASLERVRARSMAMQKSEELVEASNVLFSELHKLGIDAIRTGVGTVDSEKETIVVWSSQLIENNEIKILGEVPRNAHPFFEGYYTAWQNKEPWFTYTMHGDEILAYYKKMSALLSYPAKTEFNPAESFNIFFFSEGSLNVITDRTLSEAECKLIQRFATVFGLIYRRFLDLKLAEAQAKEALIELALERVRARTMAMQRSDELSETAHILFQQFTALGESPLQITIGIVHEEEGYIEFRVTDWAGGGLQVNRGFNASIDEPTLIQKMYTAWKGQQKSVVVDLSGKELEGWIHYRNSISGVTVNSSDTNGRRVVTCAFFSRGHISFSSPEPRPKESIQLLERFAGVFDQTYTRFLDLQKAEAQGREAKIETALERVRSRTMGMQKSHELGDVATVLFKELNQLVENLWTCGFVLCEKDRGEDEWWLSTGDGFIPAFYLPNTVDPTHANIYAAWKKGETYHTEQLEGEALQEHYDWLMKIPVSKNIFDEMKAAGHSLPAWQKLHCAYFSYGYLVMITQVPCPEEQLFKRFALVFDQTYTRFLDLQKAEAQAREAQIELALERVRARTMAMQHSEELHDTSLLLFEQLKELGEPAEQCTIGIIKVSEGVVEISATLHGNKMQQTFRHRIDEPFVMSKMFKNWKEQQKTLVLEIKEEELQKYNQYRNELVGKETFPVKLLPGDRRIIHIAYFSKGMLALSTNEPRPAESLQILARFAIVFEQTYTRFLDLQKAEAQAREAQIEAALERIRSRTMGMQKSDELKDVIQVVYDQFVQIRINIEHTGFILDYKAREDMHIWLADQHEVPSEVFIPYFDTAHWNSFLEAKEKGLHFFANHLPFEEKNKFYKTLFEKIPGVPEETKDYYFNCPGLAISTVLLDNVGLYIENFSGIPYTEEENQILLRFGKVFQQTYTRFLDLQKAEAQSRESRIEASLERVRAQAMAMHSSDDLAYTIDTFFTELKGLGVTPHRCGVGINDVETRSAAMIATTATHGNETKKVSGILKLTGHPVLDNIFEHWVKQEEYHPVLRGKEIQDYYNVMNPQVDVTTFAQDETQFGYYFFFKEGGVFAWFDTEMDESILQIFRRFTTVLSLTHRRYMDLKEAEAQTREARIEAALEKVRSRTMAMQKSAELPEAANLLFLQLQALGMPAWSAGYTLWDDDKKAITLWMSSEGVIQSPFRAPLTEDPSFIHFLEAHQRGEILHVEEVGGEALVEHYNYMMTLPGVGEVLNNIIEAGFPLPTFQIFHAAYFTHGFLLFITYEPVPDAHDIFKRFAIVFDQTYTRFLDLQKSEAQTREAQIETGLERVRSRTMAMQSCDELAETASVLLYELVKLGIAPNRLYIAIIENNNTEVHFYLTNEDGGKDCSVYTSQIEKNATVRKMYDGWATHQNSLSIILEGDELATYFQYLRDEVGVPYKNTVNPSRRIQTIAYFSQGYIGIASTDDQPEETIKLLERFAAVFNLTYTRFNDLKQAEKLAYQANLDLLRLKEEKARTEMALAELKAAQAQLIQSEKMASLGELTAGIAHEIQNPLNFVNNFSEVNTELIEEMKQELQTGNTEEAIAIANDIADNEQKINHHGKRADAIVKGMLQHSRTSSGIKEPTDINALADEYLRLAYHGLRAKDKSFNATMKTDFDPNIGLVNVIPQDIGRVILNLITNAFYAVSTPKSPKGDLPYVPTVTIKTNLAKSPSGDLGVHVSVSDNGLGIPPHILDKIFQPFFTTKPTGQGTGLGLSLSYDIVKAHGGELSVETKEGEGTTFVIQLPIKS